MRIARVHVAALLCLLAACSTPPRHRPDTPATLASETAPVTRSEPAPPQAEPGIFEPPPRTPWERLRERFRFAGCDDRADVRREVRDYVRSPGAFAASWRRALPFLLPVIDEIERRDLPGEFALLPFVESGYRPLPGKGERAAGIWQLMPATARGRGLVVRSDYDQRLDLQASTRAALDMIEHHERVFADWRLATMAYNAGEFRVRRVLAGNTQPRSATELAALPLSRTTHQHLDRVAALACILSMPARFEVELPEPDDDDRLARIELPAPMDLRLAATLAGVPLASLREWNAAYRRNRMPADGTHALFVPAAAEARLRERAARIPEPLWMDWREYRVASGDTMPALANRLGSDPGLLALANGIAADAGTPLPEMLLVPGREPETERNTGTRAIHVVRAGDTLWTIARRYRVPLRELVRLNPQANGTLRIGARLRLVDES